MEQHEQDEYNRKEVKILKHEVLKVVKETFCDAYNTNKNRPIEEQNTIGNFITVLESEIKKRIKSLDEKQ